MYRNRSSRNSCSIRVVVKGDEEVVVAEWKVSRSSRSSSCSISDSSKSKLS